VIAPGRPVYDVYERVAEHHGVPSVDVAQRLGELLAAGEHSADDLVREEVHTTALGAELTAAAIAEAVPALGGPRRSAAAPLYAESFARTRVVPAARDHIVAPERARFDTFRFAYPFIEVDSCNELRGRFDGDLLGLLVVVGPDAGFIEVAAAGARREYQLWDEYCHYDRLSATIFAPFCPAGELVRIRLLEREVDYSRCRRPPVADVLAKRLKVIGFMVRE
jgi:hypothetical protein